MATRWNPFGRQQQGQSPVIPPKTVTVPVQPTTDARKFGLENFGNTCYANSVLQALYSCDPFRDLLLQNPDLSVFPESSSAPAQVAHEVSVAGRSTSGSGAGTNGTTVANQDTAIAIPSSSPTLFSALRSLFLHIATHPSDKGTVAPKAFIEKLKEVNDVFRSTMHQDAHEFLNTLLNKMHDEETEAEKKARESHIEDLSNSVTTIDSKVPSSATAGPSSEFSLVRKLFLGILTSETRCLTCETVSSRDEEFLDLSIDIEENSSVTACLRQFSASEMLCQKNKFFCDSCCDLQEAEKRMKIKKLPNVLSLHLKRFKYQEDVQRYIKLAYRVAFPFQLRLFNTVDDTADADRLYDLFAIVVHIGNGPHHGHYISIIKTSGGWLLYDDEKISDIPESEIPKYFGDNNAGSAYVLYYRAADIDREALGLRQATTAAVPVGASVELDNGGRGASTSPVPPSHPPGLTVEGEGSENGSDESSTSYPATPSPHSSPLLISTAPGSGSGSGRDRVSVPPTPVNGDELPTPVVPPSPATFTKRGWLGPLRRTPSTSTRALPPLEPVRKDSMPVPPSPALPSPAAAALLNEEVDPTSALPVLNGSAARGAPSPSYTNGRDSRDDLLADSHSTSSAPGSGDHSRSGDQDEKERKPVKKPSGWFRKKNSLRLSSSHGRGEKDKEKEKERDRPATSNGTSFALNTPSLGKELQHPNHRHSAAHSNSTTAGRQRTSKEPPSFFDAGGFGDAAAPRHSTSSAPRSPRPKSTVSTDLHMLQQNGGAYVAEPSSYTPVSPSTPSHHPPPSAFSGHSSRPNSRLKDKHSLPTLDSPRKSKDLDRQSVTPSPTKYRHRTASPSSPRPSTATGAGDAAALRSPTKDLPPVPPVPSGMTSLQPLRYTHSNEDHKAVRRLDVPPDMVHATSSTQSSSTQSNGQPNPKKRASRKLSLTAPMLGLGFGKKKEKATPR